MSEGFRAPDVMVVDLETLERLRRGLERNGVVGIGDRAGAMFFVAIREESGRLNGLRIMATGTMDGSQEEVMGFASVLGRMLVGGDINSPLRYLRDSVVRGTTGEALRRPSRLGRLALPGR